jgi:hypothetical protein
LKYLLDGDSFISGMLINQDEGAGLCRRVEEAGDELGIDLAEDYGGSE